MPEINTLPKQQTPSLAAWLLLAAFFAVGNLYGQSSVSGESRWYRSNSSGMALELIPSRLGAMRHEYSLEARSAFPREIPVLLLPYYDYSYRIELRVLYENGEEIRRQWVFRDQRGVTRLAASGTSGLFGEERVQSRETTEGEEPEKEKRSGFIEISNSDGYITREYQYDDDLTEWEFRYTYRDGILTRTDTWFKEAPAEDTGGEDQDGIEPVIRSAPVFELAYTDYYRYTRSGSIRAIDRTIHREAGFLLRYGFPRLGPGVTYSSEELMFQGSAYSAGHFIDSGDAKADSGTDVDTISYNLDTRGRILTEILKNEDGEVVGELQNTWLGDRLQSVVWKSGGEEQRIEFEYDKDGNPTVERNYKQGVLERAVTFDGGNETEELYMNGRLVLRAYWTDGIKVSEERIFSSGGSR